MQKWLIVLAIGLAATAIGMGVSHQWHAHHETANRVKMASCLKSIGPALALGQRAAVTRAPPASQPSAGPTTRSVVITGCSKNHGPADVQFAPGSIGFATIPAGDGLFPGPQEMSVWKLLAGGKCVIVMRHAKTDDATQDAASVNLADRWSQRNLSADGIAQAKHVGQIFRDRNIPIGEVRCSEFARCRETAELAFGHAIPDSTFNALKDSEEQVRQMLNFLRTMPDGGNLVIVTHQANLLAATKMIPDMGDAVIVQPQDDVTFRVIGVLEIEKSAAQ